MPHSFGKRARTRQKFRKEYRKHGMPTISRYSQIYKIGDYVDIKVDSAVQKGMPYHFYHGRTGVVFNVTPRAVGVKTVKVVGNREVMKYLHLRVEHVRKSRCQEEFLNRVKENDLAHKLANEENRKIVTKRLPAAPKPELIVPVSEIELLSCKPYEETY